MTSMSESDDIQDSDECHEMHCEQCHEFGEKADAVAFCNVCLDFMCKSCLKYHTRLNPQHKVQEREAMPQEFCFEQCPVHHNFIRFYCSKCEMFACSECRKTNHKTCTDIKHVSLMAIGIEHSNELKEILKEINFISDKLEQSKHKLEDEIKATGMKETYALKVITQSNQNRKGYFEKQQQACTEVFEKYLKDVISVIQEEKQETVNRMMKEQYVLDANLTSTEVKNRKLLRRASKEEISSRQSLLARNSTLLDDIKENARDLKQNLERKHRCKLLLAIKKASADLKVRKYEMQKLNSEVEVMMMSTLPDQIIADSLKYQQSSISSRSDSYVGYRSKENPSEVTRKLQVQRCSNSACGQSGNGKFCQECGHKMMKGDKYDISLLCKRKIEDGQTCHSALVPGQNFCMKCGMKVDQTVQQLLEDLIMIQNASKIDHSIDVKKHLPFTTTTKEDIYMSIIVMVADDEFPKMHLLRKSNALMSSLDETLKKCCTRISFSIDGRHIVLSYDTSINEKTNFELVSNLLKKAEDVFQIFLRKLIVKNVNVPTNEWNTVRQKLEETNVSDPESIAVLIDSNSQTVRIVGDKELVQSVFQTIKPIISS